jgi:acyl-CoA thioester hydrolase
MNWDLPTPHVISIAVAPGDIDAYEHVNNTVYMTWLDLTAWDHSAALGLPLERCLELDRGMAVIRSVIAYLRPALLGDVARVGTWLLSSEGKLRVRRRFQMIRESDGVTLARAEVEYACIELSTGRPARWPAEFKERYVSIEAVMQKVGSLPPV